MLRAFLAMMLCCSFARAHESHPMQPTVRVTGQAVVFAVPDQADIDIGVVTEAKSAAAAGVENSQRTEKVIGQLKNVLGADSMIKTASYSVNPNYRYPKEGGKPEITGYTAANILRVTTSKLDSVGKIIDAATQAGANTIQNLHTSLKNEKATQNAALRDAAENARVKAETLAAALSLKVVSVLSVSENQSHIVTPLRRELALAEARDAATPIEPGQIEIKAEVTLEVIVGPR